MKTPYYIINEDFIEDELKKLKEALASSWGNYLIGYSYKTNSFPWIIEFFDKHGCYSEVVSDDEFELAKAINAKGIIYNGIAKSKETFIEALSNKSIVNIDSNYEIEWLKEISDFSCEVGIRVNFDLETRCPGQTQCGEDGERFGFCYENGELKDAIDRIQETGARVVGLHLHKSSKTRMPDIYKAIAEVAVEIVKEYNLDLKYVDIGGGFFGGLSSKPQFKEYFDMVSTILKSTLSPEKTALIVEPGMALIGAGIDYITSVLDVKRTTRNTFIVTDGSRTQIDPLMTKKSYFFDIERGSDVERRVLGRQIISGFTCMEHDRLFELKSAECLLPGDRIVYHKVGAYTMCLSPLFIKWFPDVYVKSGKKTKKVRNRWTVTEFKGAIY